MTSRRLPVVVRSSQCDHSAPRVHEAGTCASSSELSIQHIHASTCIQGGPKKVNPNLMFYSHNFVRQIYWPIFTTRLSGGGIFNDYCTANFLEVVTVKKMKIGQYLTQLCLEHLGFTFLAHPVHMYIRAIPAIHLHCFHNNTVPRCTGWHKKPASVVSSSGRRKVSC